MYMLDTNILIFSIRHPTSACAAMLADHVVSNDVCISVVTYAELEFGIVNSSDPEKNRAAVCRRRIKLNSWAAETEHLRRQN